MRSRKAPRSTSRPASGKPTTCRWCSRFPRSRGPGAVPEARTLDCSSYRRSRGGGRSRIMRAAVLRAPGAQFEITDLTLRTLGPHDVHVQIAASGVRRSDLSILDGTIPHPLPAVLGHEGAGVVLATGADVTTVAPGDHVVL